MVPGKDIPFTVKAYKQDLGVSYHAIILYPLLFEDLKNTDDGFAELSPSVL